MFYAFSLLNAGFIGCLGTGVALPPTITGFTTFGNKGSNVMQGFVVPAGITQVVLKAWGAAGAGSLGGTGSFVGATITGVSAGQQIAVKINWGKGLGSDPGGGFSAVEYPSGAPIAMIVAGGGGAHANDQVNDYYGGNAGFVGQDGQASIGNPGRGATQSGGGFGGGSPGTNGGLFSGGSSLGDFITTSDGGGGGAGYYGGGGGSADAVGNAYPGGGGSSLASGALISVTNTGLNFSDPSWNGQAAIASNGTGGAGYIVLIYS